MLAIPGFVGSALDPLVGIVADTHRRRLLLVALVIGNPATGAFVSLAQATLMDLDSEQRERNMARWTLAGSFGYVGGPILVTASLWFGLGWRAVLALLGVAAVPLTLAASRLPNVHPSDRRTLREGFAHALSSLRRREVLRWLLLLEVSDLLIDVFHGFLALYLVDVARFDPSAAALGVAAWTGAGLIGDWLLLFVLRRFDGHHYLRTTAFAALAVYPTFLLVTDDGVKLVLGFVASGVGLAATMWILLLAPVALVALVPARRRG